MNPKKYCSKSQRIISFSLRETIKSLSFWTSSFYRKFLSVTALMLLGFRKWSLFSELVSKVSSLLVRLVLFWGILIWLILGSLNSCKSWLVCVLTRDFLLGVPLVSWMFQMINNSDWLTLKQKFNFYLKIIKF